MDIEISSIPPLRSEVLHYQSPSCQLEGDTTVYTMCFASLPGLLVCKSLTLRKAISNIFTRSLDQSTSTQNQCGIFTNAVASVSLQRKWLHPTGLLQLK